MLVGQLGEASVGRIGQAEVEDGVHHAGHRELGTGADREKEGTGGIAEASPQVVLDLGQGRAHLVPQPHRNLPARGEIGAARLGGHREPGWHWQTDVGHLRLGWRLSLQAGLAARHCPPGIASPIAGALLTPLPTPRSRTEAPLGRYAPTMVPVPMFQGHQEHGPRRGQRQSGVAVTRTRAATPPRLIDQSHPIESGGAVPADAPR